MSTQTATSTFSTQTKRALMRRETIALMGLLGLVFLSRLFFVSHTLYHFDSVNFALSLEHFDILLDQPHMPGYILYVAIGQLASFVFGDANTTLVWLSVIGSVFSIAAMWLLGRAMFGRVAGWIAALLLLSSPLFWFYNEIALPHTLDLLSVTASVWLLYEVRRGRADRLGWAAIALGVAGGLRPQTLVFLAPLILFAVWGTPWKKLIAPTILLGVICLLWFVPLIMSVGGLSEYLRLLSIFSKAYQESTSVFSAGLSGLSRNLIKLGQYTAYAWGAGLVAFVMWPFLRPRGDRTLNPLRELFSRRHERAWFIIFWIAPTIVFYALIHMGQQGLVFTYLPALLLISAAAFVQVYRGMRARFKTSRQTFGAVIVALAAINAAVFVFAPVFPLGGDSVKLLTRATLVQQDREMQLRLDTIRADRPSSQTLIIAAQWRHVEYYLPGYEVVRFGVVNRWEREGGLPVARPDSVREYQLADFGLDPHGANILLFDPDLSAFTDASALSPIGDSGLSLLHWSPGQTLQIDAEGFGLHPAPGG